MDNLIILADGTELTGSILPNSDNEAIFVYLQEISIAQCAQLLGDPQKTARIREVIDSQTENVYEGYTVLYSINTDYNRCNATMRRP